MFTDQALDADANQGTTVFLLDARGAHEAADLLEVATMTYTVTDNDYGEPMLLADLAVDVALFDSYTKDVTDLVNIALNQVLAACQEYVDRVRTFPKPVEGDWRALRREGRLTGISNQATKMPLPTGHPRKYGLNFRDGAEVKVFEALERQQKSLPAEDTILIAPNALTFVDGKTREVDFLVAYRNRVGVIEVDGDTHRNRYAADQSRDRVIRDAGVSFVERIVAEDTNTPEEVDKFVRQFLSRLSAR